MPFVLPENVQETSTTTGTGQLTLDGAVTGALEFDSQLANNDTTFYSIKDSTDIEVGIGTFTNSAGNKLTRDTILYSTQGGAAVNWTTGTRNVLATMPGTALGSLTEPGSTSGVIAQIAANTYARREIEASKNIRVTNPGGVGGNIQINSSYISPKDGSYGAKGDGVTDDTAAINACIDAAEAVGDKVILEEGDYLVSGACLEITKGIHFRGEGFRSRILVDPSVDAVTDIISLNPVTAVDDVNKNFHLHDFRIDPVSGTPGRHGISIDITNRALADSAIKDVRIDQLGSEAIATLPNATPLSDGFFTSVIENCVLYGGIRLDKAGDSLRILRNTLTGEGVGVYVDLWCNNPLVDCFDGGPHGLEIIGNNITTKNGALDCRNAHMGIFENNIVEPSPGGTFHNSASISIDGIPSKPIQSFTISKNYLSTQAGNDVIYFGYADQCLVTNNYSSRVPGQVHYRVSSNAVNIRLIDCFHAGSEALATVLDDQGLQTLWWRTWAGVLEQNQSTQLEFGENILYRDSGDVSLKMLELVTGDFCKIGCTTSVTAASGGHLLMYADGQEMMRLDPAGSVIVGDPAFPGGLNPLVSGALQVESTTQGFYPPRMTTTQKNAISSPQAGCTVFDITLNGLSFYDGTGWVTAIP